MPWITVINNNDDNNSSVYDYCNWISDVLGQQCVHQCSIPDPDLGMFLIPSVHSISRIHSHLLHRRFWWRFPEVKRPDHERDSSVLSTADVRNACNLTSTPSIHQQCVCVCVCVCVCEYKRGYNYLEWYIIGTILHHCVALGDRVKLDVRSVSHVYWAPSWRKRLRLDVSLFRSLATRGA